MNYDILKLERQHCFLIYACSREIIKKYKPYLDEIGLTYTQYITMMVLWEERSMNVKSLGKRLYLDSGTLTPLLKKLEADGIITRARSSEDERNLLVTITDKGEKLREKAVEIPQKVGACINIPVDDAEELYQILYKILNKM